MQHHGLLHRNPHSLFSAHTQKPPTVISKTNMQAVLSPCQGPKAKGQAVHSWLAGSMRGLPSIIGCVHTPSRKLRVALILPGPFGFVFVSFWTAFWDTRVRAHALCQWAAVYPILSYPILIPFRFHFPCIFSCNFPGNTLSSSFSNCGACNI